MAPYTEDDVKREVFSIGDLRDLVLMDCMQKKSRNIDMLSVRTVLGRCYLQSIPDTKASGGFGWQKITTSSAKREMLEAARCVVRR